jgi:hypothetical protein
MKARTITPVAFAAVLLCAAVIAASAQDRPSVVDPKGCAPSERLQTDAPRAPVTDAGNLSDKLARNDGVICPPNVDTEMTAPPPGGGRTPIIPPPGSPGGDQSIQPK